MGSSFRCCKEDAQVTDAEDVFPWLMWLCEILWEGIAELLVVLGFDEWEGLYFCEQCSF